MFKFQVVTGTVGDAGAEAWGGLVTDMIPRPARPGRARSPQANRATGNGRHAGGSVDSECSWPADSDGLPVTVRSVVDRRQPSRLARHSHGARRLASAAPEHWQT